MTETLTTFTVKKGSSGRPSVSQEKKTETPSTIIRNRTSFGWLTAHAERLKRFIALSRDDPIALLKPDQSQNDSADTTRTFWLGSSFCTPSATTFAPSSMPPVMTTSLLS